MLWTQRCADWILDVIWNVACWTLNRNSDPNKQSTDEHASIWRCQHLQPTVCSVCPSRARARAENCRFERCGRRCLACFFFSHGNPVIHEIMSMYSRIWPLQVNLLIKDYLYAGETNRNAWQSGKRGHSTGKDNVWSSSLFVKKM